MADIRPEAAPEDITRVVAAVVRKGDRWLVCRRGKGTRYEGLWEFPGGKAEAGEDDEATIRRELREELEVGVQLVGPPILAFTDPGSGILVVFREVHIEGVPLPREHEAICWGTLPEIRRLQLAPVDRLFVDGHHWRDVPA